MTIGIHTRIGGVSLDKLEIDHFYYSRASISFDCDVGEPSNQIIIHLPDKITQGDTT